MVLFSLIKRNIKLFFKDKGLVISSLITPMILILLYVTFLRNVYVDSFHSSLPSGFTLDESYINGFVYGWLFSSLLATSCVTVSFCSNLLMVQDKVTGSIHDLQIAPVKSTTIAISYYIASMLVTLIICYLEMIVGFIIMASTGWFLSVGDVFGIILGVFLLVNFGTALSSLIHHFLSTQGQMSAVGTLVSSIYGFICGAYMPISQFGKALQIILGFLPGTYGTALLRHHFENGVLTKLQVEQNFPKEVVDGISENFDISLKFFDKDVNAVADYIIMIASVVVLIGIYVLINMRNNKLLKEKK